MRGENWREEALNTTAAKANKASALIEELERLEVSEKLDDLAARRLSREARSLMASDATGAHTVLGGIAGVEGDAAKVHEHYRAALQLSDRHPAVLSNYATALGRAGEFDEAFPTIMEAHRRAPDDASLLSNAIILAVHGGRFTESVPLYDAWNRLQPKRRHEYESAARKAADAAKRRKFTEAAVREVVRVAHEVRVAAKVRHAASTMREVFGEPDTLVQGGLGAGRPNRQSRAESRTEGVKRRRANGARPPTNTDPRSLDRHVGIVCEPAVQAD